MSRLFSIIGQMISEHQRNLDQVMRTMNQMEGFTSNSFFRDGFSNTSYQIERDDKALTINTTTNGARLTVKIALPISADTSVEIVTTDKEGKSETKQLKFSEYLKGFEVPGELKDMCAKVTKYINNLFPNLLSSKDSCGVKPEAATPATSESSGEQQPETPASAPETANEVAAVATDPYKEYTLTRDDDKDLKFSGKVLIAWRTPAVSGRFREIRVFETRGGKYVAQLLGNSVWPTEVSKSSVKVCSTKEEVLEFFGKGFIGSHIASHLGWRDEAFTEYVE